MKEVEQVQSFSLIRVAGREKNYLLVVINHSLAVYCELLHNHNCSEKCKYVYKFFYISTSMLVHRGTDAVLLLLLMLLLLKGLLINLFGG